MARLDPQCRRGLSGRSLTASPFRSGISRGGRPCPLYPRKRTSIRAVGMSALGHKPTSGRYRSGGRATVLLQHERSSTVTGHFFLDQSSKKAIGGNIVKIFSRYVSSTCLLPSLQYSRNSGLSGWQLEKMLPQLGDTAKGPGCRLLAQIGPAEHTGRCPVLGAKRE